MTRDEAKKLLPIIQAFVEGKEIQCRSSTLAQWVCIETPNWVAGAEYRVKPEAVKVEAYAVVSIGTGNITVLYALECDAVCVKNSYRDPAHWTVVKVEGTYER